MAEQPGTLYVVATPLGNLEDLSPRAVRVLQEVDLIACEDTRHTRKLLAHFQIRTPTTSYHEHNEATRAPQLAEKLRLGKKVALVADAGTPLLSDPGFRLVKLCREEGIAVTPIPGPSAAVAALSVSGLPTDRFLFVGFLPRRTRAREEELKKLASLPLTLVFYLSPHQLAATLRTLVLHLGPRPAFLVREMTKLHETHYQGSLAEILRGIEKAEPRGEYTLVVAGRQAAPLPSCADPAAYVEALMKARGLSRKEALKAAARELQLSKRDLYRKVYT